MKIQYELDKYEDKRMEIVNKVINKEFINIDEYGNITLSNSGTVYITATFAGNEQYNSRQVSYTMTVESQEEPTPVTPVSPNLSWSDSVGSYDTYTGTRNIPTLNNPNSVSVSYSSSGSKSSKSLLYLKYK